MMSLSVLLVSISEEKRKRNREAQQWREIERGAEVIVHKMLGF